MSVGPYLWKVRYRDRKQYVVVRADTPAQAVALVVADTLDRTGGTTEPKDWRATRLREVGAIGVVR